jgi:two-component system, chemotaxis family, CheB/CheR fusion protein
MVGSGEKSADQKQMENEMKRWQQDILSVMEERETAFEELQTTHEELMASTEETQMINEELENTMEDLRSANEELSSLNEELQARQQQIVGQRNFSDAIIATIHEPLVVVDREMNIHRVNNAFCEYLNTPECDIAGQQFFDVIHFDVKEVKPILNGIFKDGKKIDGKNVEAYFPAGNRVMLLNAGLISGTNPPLLLIAFKDVSEKLAAFKLLEAKNRELELYNIELKAFGSAANHDLQEPLRKTVVFAKRILSEDRALSESSRYFLERTVISMQHMQKLVNDSINYMQSGQYAPKLKATDLGMLVKKSIVELEKIIQAKHVKIEMDPLPEVKVLPEQIKQVFTSLMMNAICYSKDDVPPNVRIVSDEAGAEEIDTFADLKNRYYKISITDNGQGFDDSQADRIFDPFFRLHSKDSIPGSGLGLTLCKKIMSNHNGFIKASGKVNQGCTIDLYFPVG